MYPSRSRVSAAKIRASSRLRATQIRGTDDRLDSIEASPFLAETEDMYGVAGCHCLVENISFFPLNVREASIAAQLCKILPAIEFRAGNEVYRTRTQPHRRNRATAWESDTFVFEVFSSSVDVVATCVNTSGEGNAVIGSAHFKLVNDGRGTSVREYNLVRSSRQGSPVLAGTLQVQITYFQGQRRRVPLSLSLSTSDLFTALISATRKTNDLLSPRTSRTQADAANTALAFSRTTEGTSSTTTLSAAADHVCFRQTIATIVIVIATAIFSLTFASGVGMQTVPPQCYPLPRVYHIAGGAAATTEQEGLRGAHVESGRSLQHNDIRFFACVS